jgi:hypothetical protein
MFLLFYARVTFLILEIISVSKIATAAVLCAVYKNIYILVYIYIDIQPSTLSTYTHTQMLAKNTAVVLEVLVPK